MKQEPRHDPSGQPEEVDSSGPRMAHRDAKLAESGRYMARRKRSATAYSSDPTWSDSEPAESRSLVARVVGVLGFLPSLVKRGRRPGIISAVPDATVPETASAATGSAAPRSAATRSAGASFTLPTGRSAGPRFRFGPREPHRRELGIVLTLLLIAGAASVTLPELANSSPKSTPTQLANGVPASTTDAPSADPSPSTSASPDPTPGPTVTPFPKKTPKPKAKPYSGKKYRFVALGDSLTAWPDYAWPARLDASDVRLNLANNAGIPGNVTSQMLARLNRDVFSYNPDIVIVMGGTNDLARGYSTATTIANLRGIIVACQKRKIRVFLLTIPPDGFSGMARRIGILNAAIIHLANSYRVTYVDVHAALATKSGVFISGYGLADNVHLTARGAQALSNSVYYRIRRLGY